MEERTVLGHASQPGEEAKAVQVTTVVGFDLGHGEMALAKQAITGRAEPEVIEIHGRRSQMAALAVVETPGEPPVTLIGEDAVEAFDLAAPEAVVLEIGFKGHPARNPKADLYVPRFAAAVYQYLLDHDQIEPGDHTEFFVGYPSGWTDDERTDYERLVARSGIPRLRVVPESRAALAHAKEAGGLTVEQVKGPVLVIDIGSSTTDFSLQRSLHDETSSLGVELGGALIDRAILERMMPLQEDRVALEALVQRHPSYRTRLELICRKAKEGYFRRLDSDFYRDTGQRPVQKEMEDIQGRFIFRVTVDGPLMDEVLAQPLRELGGRSWMEQFRAVATEARERWIEPQGLQSGVVLATGGASRMDFIATICKDVFSGWQYRAGTEPELAIARGLARWGRNYLRTAGFDREIDRFIHATAPAVVENQIPGLMEQLVPALAGGLIDHVIARGLRDWRAGRLRTLQNLEPHMTNLAAEWLPGEEARELVNQVIADWLRPVLGTLHDDVLPICRRYGIAGDPFSLLIDYHPTAMSLPSIHELQDWRALVKLMRDLIALTTAAVIGALLLLVDTAFFPLGPVGWLASAGVTLAAWVGGRDAATEFVRTRDIPRAARILILSDEQVQRLAEANRPRVESSIREMLQRSTLRRQLVEDISHKLKDILEARAAEIRLLIV